MSLSFFRGQYRCNFADSIYQASVADLYVNDAFSTAHRAYASTEGITKYLKPAVAGFLMQKVFVKVKLVHVLCFLISVYSIVKIQYFFSFL